MDLITRVVVIAICSAVNAIGLYLLAQDKTGSGATALGFGFLCLVLTLLGKFKRFKGFGFEGETWEQKQEEAAELVAQLSLIADSVGYQVGLLASHVGLMSGGPTTPQLIEMQKQIKSMLVAAKAPAERIREVEAPILRRLETNYCAAADKIATNIFEEWRHSFERRVIDSADLEEREKMQRIFTKMQAEWREIAKSSSRFESVTARLIFIRDSLSISASDAQFAELTKIFDDIASLRASGSFQRLPMDYGYLWKR